MQIIEKVGAKNVQIIAAFIFGVIFLSVILYLVFSSEDLNQNRMWVVKVILSLAAAGVAAILPGFIDLEGRLPWLNLTLVRAGGALAIFCLVLIYPIQPPTPPVEVDEYVPPTVAKDKSDNWVSLIGEKDFKGAYYLT